MPSNDERREVAARLRDIAACKDYKDYLGTDDFALAIKRVVRATVPVPRTDKAYLLSIADLIEPEPERTCHVVAWYEARSRAEIGRERVKLSCGHIAERHSNYCPNCGAKVVPNE